MSLKLGTADFAKYPFLNEASKFLTESHLDVDESNRPEMEYIIDRVAIRVEVEMQGKIYKNLERHEVEVLTFLSALILVKLTNIEQILKKHSLFEVYERRRPFSFKTCEPREMRKRNSCSYLKFLRSCLKSKLTSTQKTLKYLE